MSGSEITWLDWVMAVLTVLGFCATGFGLFQAWSQAREAKTAAESASQAVSATRSQLATLDLMNELRSIRKAIADVEMAAERNEVEIAKFVMVQLAENMRKAAVLARDVGTPKTGEEIVSCLDTLSRETSHTKASLARKSSAKVGTVTQSLLPKLAELSHSLLEIETRQKYAVVKDH